MCSIMVDVYKRQDKGTIDGIEVTDVQIKKDVITHSLKEPLAVGETVHGIIDWTHRFKNMFSGMLLHTVQTDVSKRISENVPEREHIPLWFLHSPDSSIRLQMCIRDR